MFNYHKRHLIELTFSFIWDQMWYSDN